MHRHRRGEQLIVAREVGVAAFPAAGGELQFAEYVRGARPFTHDFLSYKLLMRRAGAAGASLELAELQANWARTTHLYSLQQRYYVRPFYHGGWGVTLVRLDDGRRTDLHVSPPNEPLLINAANLPLFLVERSHNRLLAKGLGVGLAGVSTYTRAAWPATPAVASGVPENWQIPFPSLLAYDLAQLPFRSGDTRAAQPDPWPQLGEHEQQLRRSISWPAIPRR